MLLLEALQRIRRRLELSLLERQPSEEVVRLLRRRLTGELLRDLLEPLDRLLVLVQLQQPPGPDQHRLGRRRRRASRGNLKGLLRIRNPAEREEGLRPE